MAISTYVENEKQFWQVYVNVRSSVDSSLRLQARKKGLESEQAAIKEEKRLIKRLTEELAKAEGKGLTWATVVQRWETAMKDDPFKKYNPLTVTDYANALRIWTVSWLNRPASELNRGDAREVIQNLETEGRSRKYQVNIKNIVNVIFDWAIEERLIRHIHESPMRGLKIDKNKIEKVPDIFTLEEIKTLLREAKNLSHPWYPVWVLALLTGMRNGELHALLWTDVDFENRKLTVSKSYNTRLRSVKSTKAGYWRTVPMSDELYAFLKHLHEQRNGNESVLPRFREWNTGEQAAILRTFCKSIGLPSIRFHALRACFATQLLAHDIAPARVMKICGWRDLNTMQRYVRYAGIDEKGATQVLKILNSDTEVIETVGNLFDFEGK